MVRARPIGATRQGLGACRRPLLNFGGVRYLSGTLLARLIRLRNWIGAGAGFDRGVGRLLRDLLRISGPDRAFDDCAGKAEALGRLVR